ncbi:hypothetical protein [Bradyrhizobium erythrophlei]|uniref:Uncharacterized protein n=1 Tax=Bradyrhizobium erythrophlei TaxID=1437360 RepID=A0A1M5R3D6_9BRAD|nr:hypothetical protein [Bradyrhizobium erythrophlei]SHH20894.1 hypothetical protein SAMN05444169_6324 [Bradyrhizobium erythrophlei]
MRSAAQASDPAQQTRPENALDLTVGGVLASLEQAARGDHTAWALSNAMESVEAHYRDAKTGPISTAQCDELLSAVIRAQLGAIKHLPESYRREQIDAGMQALAGQVMLWAETRERSKQRTWHALADLGAYARMFRNDLHNISLVEEVERRAWQRRDAEIQKLMRPDGRSEAAGA